MPEPCLAAPENGRDEEKFRILYFRCCDLLHTENSARTSTTRLAAACARFPWPRGRTLYGPARPGRPLPQIFTQTTAQPEPGENEAAVLDYQPEVIGSPHLSQQRRRAVFCSAARIFPPFSGSNICRSS